MDGVIIFILVFGSIMSLLFVFIICYFGCDHYCKYKSIETTELNNIEID